jgi:hypothetical protein
LIESVPLTPEFSTHTSLPRTVTSALAKPSSEAGKRSAQVALLPMEALGWKGQ